MAKSIKASEADRLNNEHARILIGMQLRGKALQWLYSKAELIELFVEIYSVSLRLCSTQ